MQHWGNGVNITQLRVSARVWLGVAVLPLAMVVAGCSGDGQAVQVSTVTAAAANDAIEETLKVKTAELHGISPEDIEEEPTGVTEPPAPPPEGVADVGGEYRIGAGDILSFRSYDDSTLNEEVTVRYDGYISLPLIPDVNVLNVTRETATERVREAYEEFFIDPQISLSVQEVTSKSYYVVGDVERPDEYPFVKPVTVLEAIYNAGGQRIETRGGDAFVGAQGQLVKAFVIRDVQGDRSVIEYDLRDIATPGPHASDAPVYPGDLVYVPEGVNLVYLLGELRTPSVTQLTPDMTLLQLLAQVGGYNVTTARLREVIIMRELDEQYTAVIRLNLRKILSGESPDVRMQAGDVVYVPERRFFRLQTFVQQFTGSISPLLSLYDQAFNSYYTERRLRQLYDNDDAFNNAFQTGDLGLLSQLLRDVQGFAAPLP